MKVLYLVVLALSSIVAGDVQNIPRGVSFATHWDPMTLHLTFTSKDEVNSDIEQNLDILETPVGRSIIGQAIEDALNGFRDVVINGNDDLPPLDPFVVDAVGPYQQVINGINVRGGLTNIVATGLQWYVVDYVDVNAVRLTLGLHLTLPWFQVTSAYNADARILFVSHTAVGNIRVFVNRLELGVDARLGTNILAGHLLLRDLAIRINIHDTLIQIDGMTGSSTLNSLISQFIQSTSQQLVQSQLEAASTLISQQLFDIINDVLKDYTINDIIG